MRSAQNGLASIYFSIYCAKVYTMLNLLFCHSMTPFQQVASKLNDTVYCLFLFAIYVCDVRVPSMRIVFFRGGGV